MRIKWEMCHFFKKHLMLGTKDRGDAASALWYELNNSCHSLIKSRVSFWFVENFHPVIPPPTTVSQKKQNKTLFWTAMRNILPARTQLLIFFLSRFSMWHHEKPSLPSASKYLPEAITSSKSVQNKKMKMGKKGRDIKRMSPSLALLIIPVAKWRIFIFLLNYFGTIWQLMECNDSAESIQGIWKGSEKAIVKISSCRSKRLIYGTANCGCAVSWRHRCRRRNF